MTSWLSSPAPEAAIEVAADRVTAAIVTEHGTRPVVRIATEPLPAGAVVPALTTLNVTDRAKVAAATRRALDGLETRVRRVALILPDTVARVSIVSFDQVPARREDLEQLVRWQLKKSAPFPVEDAVVTYSPGLRSAEHGAQFVAVMARRDVIQQYESVCDAAGVEAGLVDLATLSVVNLLLSRDVPPGDWLLVHMRPEYVSLVIGRGSDVIFFRSRPEGEESTLADVVHQTAMYFQDRLAGARFTRVLLCGEGRTSAAIEQARSSLEERLDVRVDAVDPTRVVAFSDLIVTAAEARAMLSPLVGMLMRSHGVVVS